MKDLRRQYLRASLDSWRQQRVLRAAAARKLGTFLLSPSVDGLQTANIVGMAAMKIERHPAMYWCGDLDLDDVLRLDQTRSSGQRARVRRELAPAVAKAVGDVANLR